MQNSKQHLILNKGGEKFVFRYEQGHEQELFEVIVEQAEDDRTDFDWIDAAVLQLKLAHMLVERRPNPSPPSLVDRMFPFRR